MQHFDVSTAVHYFSGPIIYNRCLSKILPPALGGIRCPNFGVIFIYHFVLPAEVYAGKILGTIQLYISSITNQTGKLKQYVSVVVRQIVMNGTNVFFFFGKPDPYVLLSLHNNNEPVPDRGWKVDENMSDISVFGKPNTRIF